MQIPMVSQKYVEVFEPLRNDAASAAGTAMVGAALKRRGAFFAVKRVFDLVASMVGLVVVMPVMAIIAIAIKLDSRGPVFYRQVKVGRFGCAFEMLKFRTMVIGNVFEQDLLAHLNERDPLMFRIRYDPRITRVGRFLRRYSFDELPQFLNVIAGEMSIIGPRPVNPFEALNWPQSGRDRFLVKPGITGLWQVTDREDTSFEHMVQLDSQYVRNLSIFSELRILFRTFRLAFSAQDK